MKASRMLISSHLVETTGDRSDAADESSSGTQGMVNNLSDHWLSSR